MKSWWLKCVEREIIEYLNNGKNVYIESGAANDEILLYEIDREPLSHYPEDDVIFVTSACIFPERIVLSCWDNVDTEEFNGNLFLHVW